MIFTADSNGFVPASEDTQSDDSEIFLPCRTKLLKKVADKNEHTDLKRKIEELEVRNIYIVHEKVHIFK